MKKSMILVGVLIFSFVFMASATANYTQTLSENQCQGVKHDPVLQFTQTPRPAADGTLTVSAIGDYSFGNSNETIEVVVEGTSLGVWNPGVQCGSGLLTKTYTVTKSQLLQWSADGNIEVTLIQGSSVDCFCGNEINIVTLDYPTASSSLPMQQFMKILGLGNKDKE